MLFQKPRLIIAALRGGAGKTLISIGLLAAWRRYCGLRVVPFKKGPDYIDAGWLARAAEHTCYNLDPFLMSGEAMLSSLVQRSRESDGCLIEGNRGLYDGVDLQGSFSTAELAKLLRTPLLLVVDATKVTRTAAAQVVGCLRFDPEVRIAGVLLNQVGGARHEQILRGTIEHYCNIPVLGAIPRQGLNLFPERHLGLVPPQESRDVPESLEFLGSLIHQNVDLRALWDVAKSAAPLGNLPLRAQESASLTAKQRVTIGVLRDAAFQFYYPENLEALQERGAFLREISSFTHEPLPSVDALYIGGGFPETHLEILANNQVFRKSLRAEIDKGLPVYAECGGLMFLGSHIHHLHARYPMVGVFSYDTVMEKRPQGHGYTMMECFHENPFFPKGALLKGHEFHYSRIIHLPEAPAFVFRLSKGHGIVAGWDGICYKNTLASYSHIHAVGNESWAEAMIKAALSYQRERLQRTLMDCQLDYKKSILETLKQRTAL